MDVSKNHVSVVLVVPNGVALCTASIFFVNKKLISHVDAQSAVGGESEQ